MAAVLFLLCERDIAIGLVATTDYVMRIPVEER